MMEVHSSVTSRSLPHISWLQNWWQSGVFFYFLYSMLDFLLPILIFLLHTNMVSYYGPTQVKSRLLISSIFDAMNFQHFFEMLEIMLQLFWKMPEIHCIKNARNLKSIFDLRWLLVLLCIVELRKCPNVFGLMAPK